MFLINSAKAALKRFARDEDASLVAEAILVLPALVWWYVGIMVFFHGYEARNVNLKAAYTISDMLSREDGNVNAAYMEGLDNIFDYLTAGHGTNGRIRVTMVRCSDNCDGTDEQRVLRTDWSYATDNMTALTDADMSDYKDVIPLTKLGDRVILMETWVDYEPAWEKVGLNVSEFHNQVVTRPRFLPQIKWDS